MARARRDMGKAQPVQQLAHAALVLGNPEQLGEPCLDVTNARACPSPGQARCVSNPRPPPPARPTGAAPPLRRAGRPGPLRPRRCSGAPSRATLAGPRRTPWFDDPCQPRRVRALVTGQDQAPGYGRVVRPARQPAQVRRRVLRSCDRNRRVRPHHHGSRPSHTPPSRSYSRLGQSRWCLVLPGQVGKGALVMAVKPPGHLGAGGANGRRLMRAGCDDDVIGGEHAPHDGEAGRDQGQHACGQGRPSTRSCSVPLTCSSNLETTAREPRDQSRRFHAITASPPHHSNPKLRTH